MFPSNYQPFVEELARLRGQTQEVVRAALIEAARGSLGSALGPGLELAFVGPLDELRAARCFDVVEVVRDPAREVALAEAQAARPEVRVGERVRVGLRDARAPEKAGTRAVEGLAALLGGALDAVLQRDFPAPDLPADSLWGTLLAGGGWLLGQRAEAEGVALTIESASLAFTRLAPNHGWVEVKVVAALEREGGRERWELNRSENDGIAVEELAARTGPAAEEALRAALGALAAEVAARDVGGLSSYTACVTLLSAATAPPAPGSLWAWCGARLGPLLVGERPSRTIRGRHLGARLQDSFGPWLGLSGAGRCGVTLTLFDPETGEERYSGVSLGRLGRETFDLPAPDPAAERDLEAMAATWKEWLDVHVAAELSSQSDELMDGFFEAAAGHFPLAELWAARVRHGPPPPLPVPRFDAAAIARAAELLRPAAPATRARLGGREEQILAVFEAGPYAIVLADDLRRAFPFAAAFVGLLAPGVDRVCEVLRVDVWNPPARAVVDGDAFAFRRLCEWLRGGLVAAGLDREIVYTGELDADEDDEDDEDEEVEEVPPRMLLSEWLRFGLPDTADRFLVDWRHQWHVAFAGPGIVECFGGIYGMSGGQREQIASHDRRVWRAFLREVVDPRFSA